MSDGLRELGNRKQVLISYHFFAHYRSAVFERLKSAHHQYFLCADTEDPRGAVKAIDTESLAGFLPIRSRLFLRMMFQFGLITKAIDAKYECMILLGDASFVTTWIAALISRFRGKRVLFWTHGWSSDEVGIKSKVRNTFYSLADGLLLYGRDAKRIGIKKGFLEDSLYLVYNSLDYPEHKRLRESIDESDLLAMRTKLFSEPNLPIVVCCSRLYHGRRFDLLLDATRRLHAAGHKINVLLVGDGEARSDLETQAKTLGIAENVAFYGSCYDQRTLAICTSIGSVTVAPGSVGLTAVQSLAFGVPVITHDNRKEQGPEVELVRPGVTGDLFHQNDPTDLASCISNWTCDSVEGSEVRSNCIALVERTYTPDFQARTIDAAVSGLPAQGLPEQECC